ncbi:MAG: M42 family metallopeptidase [Anaerolineales bacterium]|nr:M42 family metallopeptidase [Anaerolineales bacterium]
MKSLIKKLTETYSPSGYEAAIREVIQAEIKDFSDETRVDALGNLIARKGTLGKGGKRIMLAAHMDEIGVIATHIDENGFVRFAALGGVFPHTLVGSRVRFINGTPGVVGARFLVRPIKLIPLDKMYIDVGATSPKDCPVKIGDVAAFERPFADMGTRVVAKSLDDRIGVAILIETLRQLKTTPHEIHFVFTVQEEVGVRGAATSAFGVNPQIGIAVDVTGAGDTPNMPAQQTITLGAGPTVKFKDAGNIADSRVNQLLIGTAEKKRIPYQREVATMGGTDARAIQLTRAGVPAATLSIPCRYVHTPSEMIALQDVENSVKLLLALFSKPISL